MNKRISSEIAIGIIIIFAIIVGYSFWKSNNIAIAPTINTSVTTTTQPIVSNSGTTCQDWFKILPDGSEVKMADPNCNEGWKTYRNDKYGYEMQYPISWSILPDNNTNYQKYFQLVNDKNEFDLSIAVYDSFNDSALERVKANNITNYLEEVWNTNPANYKGDHFYQMNLNDINAYAENDFQVHSNKDQFSIFFENKGKIYKIYFLGKAKYSDLSAEEKNSLSTFKFIDSNIETADWQTYRNDKYGFEFMYPKDWKVVGDTPVNVMIENKNKISGDISFDLSVDENISTPGNRYKDAEKRWTQMQTGEYNDCKKINIAGNDAFRCIVGRMDVTQGANIIYNFKKDNIYYEFTIITGKNNSSDNYEGDGIGDKILSTFKFTK